MAQMDGGHWKARSQHLPVFVCWRAGRRRCIENPLEDDPVTGPGLHPTLPPGSPESIASLHQPFSHLCLALLGAAGDEALLLLRVRERSGPSAIPPMPSNFDSRFETNLPSPTMPSPCLLASGW